MMREHYDITGSDLKKYRRDFKLINKIIIHCSDSDQPRHDDISVIKAWHKCRGFVDVGYHFFIKKDGTIQEGRPLSWVGAHCENENLFSIGICLSGSKQFNDAEFLSCLNICKIMMDRFKIAKERVYPHNFFNKNKTCPNFKLDKIWELDKP